MSAATMFEVRDFGFARALALAACGVSCALTNKKLGSLKIVTCGSVIPLEVSHTLRRLNGRIFFGSCCRTDFRTSLLYRPGRQKSEDVGYKLASWL